MLKIKKIFLFFIYLNFFVFISSCKSNSRETILNSNNLKLIQIASVTPLSGNLEAGGISIKNGVQLAVEGKEDMLKKLGYQIELIPFDDKADIETGINVANKIVNNENIYAVVGHYNSGVTFKTSKIYNKNNMTMVSPASTAVEITAQNYNNINRIVAKDSYQGKVAAKFSIEKLGLKKAFLINDGTKYGKGITDEFEKYYKNYGGKINNIETIESGQRDFTSTLNKLKKSNSEILYFGGMYPEAINLIKQLNREKIDIEFIGTDGMDTYEVIESAGESALESYYTTTAGAINDSNIGKVWLARYENKFNMSPNNYSVYGYDAADVILEAIINLITKDKGKGRIPTRQEISKSVRKIKGFKGLSTNISFDDNGDNLEAQIFIYKYEELVYPASLIEKINVCDLNE